MKSENATTNKNANAMYKVAQKVRNTELWKCYYNPRMKLYFVNNWMVKTSDPISWNEILISDVINYRLYMYIWSCDAGKINVHDKIVIEDQKKWNLNNFFIQCASKIAFKSGINWIQLLDGIERRPVSDVIRPIL